MAAPRGISLPEPDLTAHDGASRLLGIHLNGGGEDLTAEQVIPFVGRQPLQIEPDALPTVRNHPFERVSLRLAPFSSGHHG